MNWVTYRTVYWNLRFPGWLVLSLGLAACTSDGSGLFGEQTSAERAEDGSDSDTQAGEDRPELDVDNPGDALDWLGPDFEGSKVPLVPDCAAQVEAAQVAPVDMHIMLDRSGSMLESTSGGTTKWTAIGQALTSFVSEPRSAGLGVGLAYFPRGNPGVPEACSDDAQCGAEGGPCLTRACLPTDSDPGFTLCVDDDDCLGSTCVPYGVCSGADNLYCFEFGDQGCGSAFGSCLPTTAECLDFASCNAEDYTTPTVPIGLLPGHGDQLIASVNSTQPVSTTPTAAALGGALDYARSRARMLPDHKVVVVLATDGLPTGCDPSTPSAVAELAAGALAGPESISTYVIGVFSSSESSGPENSNLWARAGGTGQAFIVDPGGDLSAEFLEALKTIRYGSVGCEYQLPSAPQGEVLDFGMVNVAFIGDEASIGMQYVGDPTRCGEVRSGWYYDADPISGGIPSRIELCPQACQQVSSELGGRVEIYVGCETQAPI